MQLQAGGFDLQAFLEAADGSAFTALQAAYEARSKARLLQDIPFTSSHL